jgi:hypothetical protein
MKLPPPAVQDFSWALPARILLQLNMPELDRSFYHYQDPDRPWEGESLWACRARIEQQRLAEPFGFRLVGMAKDADVRSFAIQKGSSGLREFPAFIQNMTDGDTAACQFDHGPGRKSALFLIVDVAGDGRDRSDLLQLFNHGLIANVPGVEDMIDASEVSPDGRIEQAMGIGNHSDSNGSALVHGAATG